MGCFIQGWGSQFFQTSSVISLRRTYNIDQVLWIGNISLSMIHHHSTTAMKTTLNCMLVLTVLSLAIPQLFGNTESPAEKKNTPSKNRTACLANQVAMQRAMRGYMSINQLPIGASINWDKLQKAGFIKNFKLLKCPSGGKYTILKTIPKHGVLVMSCSHGKDLNHRPKDTKNW